MTVTITLPEDFCIDDYTGGNQDDAYYLGERRGSQWLAMSIVENISNEPREA